MKRLQQVVVWLIILLMAAPNGVQAAGQGHVSNESGTTYTGGRLAQDTIWTKEGSPYRIHNILMLEENVTLTIEAGVTVLFEPDAGFNFTDGTLNVNGTGNEKVVFQFDPLDIGANQYNQESLYIGSNNKINHAEIHHAGIGIYMFGRNNVIENTEITNSDRDGILVQGKENRILHSSLTDNHNGITVYGEANVFIDNTIDRSLQHGLDLSAAYRNIFINNTVGQSGGYGVYADIPYSDVANRFYHNTFQDNAGGLLLATSSILEENNILDHIEIARSDDAFMSLTENYWGQMNKDGVREKISAPEEYYQIHVEPFRTEKTAKLAQPIPAPPLLNPIADNSLTATGTATPGDTVTITQADGFYIIKKEAMTDATGAFSVALDVPFAAGTQLGAYTTNPYGVNSTALQLTVHDGTGPLQPMLEEVSNKSVSIKGTGERGAKVTVTKGESVLAEGSINEQGTFELPIQVQPEGTELEVLLQDAAGNLSEPLTIIVKDRIAPEPPVVQQITTSSTEVKGNAEAGSRVLLKTKHSVLVKETTAGKDGAFALAIVPQALGTILYLSAVDQAGNESTGTPLIVGMKELKLASFSDAETLLQGTSEPFARVEVNVNGRYAGQTEADALGAFTYPLGRQAAGAQVSARAYLDGFSSEAGLVVTDQTPPARPTVVQITERTTQAVVVAEKNAVVTISVEKREIGRGLGNGVQEVSIPIPAQKPGTILQIVAVDEAGNRSEAVTMVVKDVAPNQPAVQTVTNKAGEVKGTAEPNVSVSVKIGTKTYSTTADSKGAYKVSIPYQRAGTSIVVTAKDAGGTSPGTTVIVTRVAPDIPKVNKLTNKAAVVTGTTEAAATVKVTIGSKTYSAKADAKGAFSVSIPVQNTGAAVSITATDANKAVSRKAELTVSRAAPNVPVVNSISNKATSVSGKMEAGASVTVKIGSKTYTGKADTKGGFKITIPVQNTGVKVAVTAKDKDGKVSAAAERKVERVAPNMPTVHAVKTTSTAVTGKTEKHATVTVKIGTKSYSAKANSNGEYKVTIPKQKKGTKLQVSAKDSKGNQSATRTVTVG